MGTSAMHLRAAATRILLMLVLPLATVACTVASAAAAAKAPVTVSIAVPDATLRAGSTQFVTVMVQSDDGRTVPTGTVSLRVHTAGQTVHEQTLDLTPASDAGSTATTRISFPSAAGSFGADATYNGDEAHQTGFAHEPGMLLYASSVSVSSSRNPSPSGDDVELTFTVVSQNPSATPVGHVRVRSATVDRLLPLANGTATLTLEGLDPGRHDFSVDYWPDTLHLRSGATFRQAVDTATTSVPQPVDAVARARAGTGRGRSLFLGGLIAEGRSGEEVGPFGAHADGRTTTRLIAGTSLVGSWSSPASSFAPRREIAAMPALARASAGSLSAGMAP